MVFATHPVEANKPRVSNHEHLKALAQAAIGKMPGGPQLLEKHFSKQLIVPEVKPVVQKDVVLHTPGFTI